MVAAETHGAVDAAHEECPGRNKQQRFPERTGRLVIMNILTILALSVHWVQELQAR